MALPVRPSNNGEPKPASENAADLGAMPDLSSMALPSMPELPSFTPEPEVRRPAVQETSAVQSRSEAPRSVTPQRESKQLPEGWEIDAETGKPFKQLTGYKKGVMKHSSAVIKAGGMTLTQLRAAVDEEPDFNLDDLNGSAETFLSHLRVPPNKEEQKRLIEERAKRQKAFDEAASRIVEEDDFED